jgi:predicted dehydrogenase
MRPYATGSLVERQGARVTRKLRIAIAGTGFGEHYAIGLKAQPEVEVVSVFSRRLERAAAMAQKYEIPHSTRSFEEMLRIPYLDAVAVVTPNSTHAEFVEAAIRARKHVICDKPLALSGAEASELYRLAEAAGVRHVTFVPYRFSPAAAAIRQAARSGQLGRMVNVRGSWGVDLRREPLRWRFQRKLSGPGVAADLGAHVIDLMLWWAGPIRRVLGRCKTLVPERPSEVGGRVRPVDVPDECWSLIEFAVSGVGSVKLSWNAKRNQVIEMEGHRGRLVYDSPSLLQWLGGKGKYAPSAKLMMAPGSERATDLPLQMKEFGKTSDALARMFRDIVSYLRTGEKPDSVATFREGAEVLRVIDALEESNTTGRWAEVVPTA